MLYVFLIHAHTLVWIPFFTHINTPVLWFLFKNILLLQLGHCKFNTLGFTQFNNKAKILSHNIFSWASGNLRSLWYIGYIRWIQFFLIASSYIKHSHQTQPPTPDILYACIVKRHCWIKVDLWLMVIIMSCSFFYFRHVTASQTNFFRMLDEKIEQVCHLKNSWIDKKRKIAELNAQDNISGR